MPEAPSVPQHVRDAIRSLHSNWDVEWQPRLRRFAVVKHSQWRGRSQSVVQHVCQDDDGSFRQPDQRLVDYVRQQWYRDRNGYYDEEQVKNRDERVEQDAKRETQNDIESRRDEAETRVRLAKWTGRKRRNG
jgi:hypothetical protein